MSAKVFKHVGQEWQICHFEWGLERYVVVCGGNENRLILMNVLQDTATGAIHYEPVCHKDLTVYAGEDND